MHGKLIKVLLSVAVVGSVITYLLWSTAGEAFEYYKHVDEVAAETAKWQKKPMQLHGYVKPGSIQKRFDRESGKLEYKFVEINCEKEIDVYYAGVVPDTFKDGAEVVVKGTFDGQTFHSTEVMAKCPSKYESQAQNPAVGGHLGAKQPMCARGKAN